MEIEQEHINQDQSDTSVSQSLSPDKKNCKYCRTSIQPDASVCQHCRYHQHWWLNYFQQFGFLVSVVVLGVSIWQFMVASEQRTKAEEALQKASAVKQVAEETRLLLEFNLLLTQATSDDSKAFDDLWKISTTRENPYHDVAHRAVNTMIWSNSTLPKNPSLIQELQLLDYNKLLQYYQQTPNIDSSSVLLSIDGNMIMNDEEKTDFMARIIEDDNSFRVIQRTCCYIKASLADYRQVNPGSHNRVVAKCNIYGKLWEFTNVKC